MVRKLLGFPRDDSKPNPSTYNCDNTVTDSCFGGSPCRIRFTPNRRCIPRRQAGSPMSAAQPLHVSTGGAYRGSELASDLLTRLFRRLPMVSRCVCGMAPLYGWEPIQARKSRPSSWCFAIPRSSAPRCSGEIPCGLPKPTFAEISISKVIFSQLSPSRTTCRSCKCPWASR